MRDVKLVWSGLDGLHSKYQSLVCIEVVKQFGLGWMINFGLDQGNQNLVVKLKMIPLNQ